MQYTNTVASSHFLTRARLSPCQSKYISYLSLSLYIYLSIDLSILNIGHRSPSAELSRCRTIIHGHCRLVAKVSRYIYIYISYIYLYRSIYIFIFFLSILDINHRPSTAKLPRRRTFLHGHRCFLAKVRRYIYIIYLSIDLSIYILCISIYVRQPSVSISICNTPNCRVVALSYTGTVVSLPK